MWWGSAACAERRRTCDWIIQGLEMQARHGYKPYISSAYESGAAYLLDSQARRSVWPHRAASTHGTGAVFLRLDVRS